MYNVKSDLLFAWNGILKKQGMFYLALSELDYSTFTFKVHLQEYVLRLIRHATTFGHYINYNYLTWGYVIFYHVLFFFLLTICSIVCCVLECHVGTWIKIKMLNKWMNKCNK